MAEKLTLRLRDEVDEGETMPSAKNLLQLRLLLPPDVQCAVNTKK
jgi:hypothetical protein